MLTDIRPVVERLLRHMMVAGLPVMAAACGDRPALGDGGMTASGGRAGSGGMAGGGAPGGGTGTASGGNSGAGGASACQPLTVTCGTPMPCIGGTGGSTGNGGGSGTGATPPLTTAMYSFEPDDPRWAALYRACVAGATAPACGPDCAGFCRAFAQANGTTPPAASTYLKCDVRCDSPNQLTITYALVCGRRFMPGGRRRAWRAASLKERLGRFLSEAAELEAESVPAFARLARGLVMHGAPDDLVCAARAATTEEARHWKRTRALARRHGGLAVKPKRGRADFASLEDLALDNVVEGCVRETYGAMVAAHQAAEALDPGVRSLMTEIAADELGHAALSWQIDGWACARLGEAFETRRRDAALAAAAELISASSMPIAEDLQAAAGLPSPATTRAMLAAMCTSVWGQRLGDVAQAAASSPL